MEVLVGTDLMFGNTVGGSIHGFKFEDVDGDGTYNADIDAPLAGVTFNIFGVTGMGGDVAGSATTDSNGEFWFTDLPPSIAGTPTDNGDTASGYTIIEEVPSGFVATTPTSFTTNLESRQELVAIAGQAMLPDGDPRVEVLVGADLMFGNTVYGSIHGYKFEDVDGNGVFDADIDLPLAGVTFTLTGTDGLGNVINVPSQTTNQDGEFWFTDLPPSVAGTPTPIGTEATGYTISEEVRPGFVATTTDELHIRSVEPPGTGSRHGTGDARHRAAA